MGTRGYDEWENNTQAYTEGQVEAVLEEVGVEIVGETHNDFLGYCPYHGNMDTPAFSVSKTKGTGICFNPSCEVVRSLDEIVMDVKHVNAVEAMRFIIKKRTESQESVSDRIKSAFAKPFEFTPFPREIVEATYQEFWKSPHAIEYMHGRGFDDETLHWFKVGYSNKIDWKTQKPKNMITVPMHDPKGTPVGLIGRTASTEDKNFKNSVGLPKRETLFNLHRAKREGGTVVVVESSFDALRVHQAGFPCVVALLGNITPKQLYLLNRYFSTIIIFTDNDANNFYPNCRKCRPKDCQGHKPGRALGRKIQESLKGKRILWAADNMNTLYPRGVKDATDMTDDEIRCCLKGAVSTREYNTWGLD